MREKFKKAEKGGKDLDLKDFGYEIIDDRFVEPEYHADADEEAEEELSEAGESDINNDVEDQVDRMSIHSSELNSENLQDSEDE